MILLDWPSLVARRRRSGEVKGIDQQGLAELGFAVQRDYESSFGLPQVIMQSVDVAGVTDRPGRGLAERLGDA
jgi:hypothetical protein